MAGTVEEDIEGEEERYVESESCPLLEGSASGDLSSLLVAPSSLFQRSPSSSANNMGEEGDSIGIATYILGVDVVVGVLKFGEVGSYVLQKKSTLEERVMGGYCAIICMF